MASKNRRVRRERHRLNARAKRAVRSRIFTAQAGRCALCGDPMQMTQPDFYDYATIDHIVPLSKGGEDTARNRQLVCSACNQEKGAQLPAELENRGRR